MNVKIKIQIQHLWFIEELLQKILTIEERCFSWKTSQPGICRIGVEKFYRSYSQPPSSDRTFCRNSCEMWSENRWRYIYKIIHIKSNCQDVYSSMLIFQSQGYCSEVLSVWNYSEKNHYKNIWRMEFVGKVKHIIQLSHVLQSKLVKVFFFYSNTYIDCLVAEFPVLEHLYSFSLYPINFKKTSLISRKWKIDWDCECLVRMQW